MGSPIEREVCEAYSKAARDPLAEHPFPVGRKFALELGYPAELLDSIPTSSVEAFTGVSNASIFAEIKRGSTVLDLGCGAGLDSLVAARKTGPSGAVLGVDFSEDMLRRASDSGKESGAKNFLPIRGDAGSLPVADASIDVALVNGIFNLNPARESIFRELARVVKKGGSVFAAELILAGPKPSESEKSKTNWFA